MLIIISFFYYIQNSSISCIDIELSENCYNLDFFNNIISSLHFSTPSPSFPSFSSPSYSSSFPETCLVVYDQHDCSGISQEFQSGSYSLSNSPLDKSVSSRTLFLIYLYILFISYYFILILSIITYNVFISCICPMPFRILISFR